ncbi:hypothetical protein LWP59_23135 [Amycolatopsis acidiphila]|uniref:hypothetical protein n=1 Tax=Amycolatopsis acidiphila TaxID=715473 RepID=UPI0019A38509|nr:hypothetical protein [Amycolatopsis acidiphila]UIJ57051.1 hypothetical protein LWP59_23135 [Amycolatopsis acidiphila]GHG53641.1 hypothetical protein GCM10017788_02520 [Amycolatopsis acidiphila]
MGHHLPRELWPEPAGRIAALVGRAEVDVRVVGEQACEPVALFVGESGSPLRPR